MGTESGKANDDKVGPKVWPSCNLTNETLGMGSRTSESC